MDAAGAWVLAGALWAGCLLSGPWWLAPGGLAMLAAARIGAGGTPRRRRAALALAAVALTLAGAGLTGGRAALRDGGALPALAARGGAATMRATVVTEARSSDHGAWLLLRVTELDGHAVRERALLRVDDLADAPAIGARLALSATARPLAGDGFDAWLRRLHTAVALDVQRIDVSAPPGQLLAVTTTVRTRTRRAFHRRLERDHAALLAGLTVGDTHGRSPAREQQFTAAGLRHLVVVSGRHVAVLLAGLTAAAALFGVGASGRRWLGLCALAWFTVLVRWQPSVLRAAVMAGVVLGAGLLGRGRDARHVLAMAVILLLFADPMLAGQLGFALSVLATAGVLVVAPWLAERLPGPRVVRLPLAVTLGAQAGAAPVLLAWFDGLGLAALPANVVAVPAAAAAQAAGLLAALVAQVSLDAGSVVALLATPALAVVLWAAETFAHGPVLRVEHLLTPTAGLLAVALTARRRAPRLAAGALIAALAGTALPTLRPPPAVEQLRVTAFDVGQGDALLVEAPGDPPARLLYDGGPEPDLALAHLRRRGIDRLDVVAMSHVHHDHVAGLPAVLAGVDVGAFVVGPLAAEEHHEPSSPAVRAAHRAARRAGVPVVAVRAGQRFTLGAATVEVLSPPADGTLGGEANANSVVLRVATDHGALLLTGDAEQAAQRRLLRQPARLRADVVQVPHHGGNTNAEGFLAAVGAQRAVLSVGADNEHGHPHPAVIDDLVGVDVRRTDRDGTVTVPVLARRPASAPTLTRR